MQRPLRQSWTCIGCLKRQQISRRSLATAATASRPFYNPALSEAPSVKHDDAILRKVFDSQSFWNEFSQSGRATWSRKSVGLFRNHHLKTPQGFDDFAHITLEKCRRLVAKVLGISTQEGYRSIVQDLDRLSDLLCRIIDLADFVRSTHPDPAYQNAAAQAHGLMFEYMNTLNTTTGLYEQLQKAMDDPEVTKSWSEEEMRVAMILKRDFSQSAIDLPASKRQNFVDLSNKVNVLGSHFIEEMAPATPFLKFSSTKLKGVNPVMLSRNSNSKGNVLVPSIGSLASHILRFAEDEEVRKEVYIASRTASDRQVKVLEELLRARAELSQLSGFNSYAHMALTDKMARTPEAVVKFLEALSADNEPSVRKEVDAMLSLKRQSPSSTAPSRINAWDRDFYRSRLSKASKAPPTRTPDFIPAYFSLGTVMQGLSRLFTRLYGVRFVPAEPAPGETWTASVRRLNVLDESEGLIAVVYCDLFARPGKSPNPAHFTLRCSRHLSCSEIGSQAASPHHPNTSPLSLANDGMATSPLHPRLGTASQLPTIALICDFPAPSDPSTPPLLPTPHLTTLFHEMGHAIHSILGRTRLQNVAGTRCATDFAELPSVLMERFATHPSVLALYARHWETDAPLPPALVRELQTVTASDASDAADSEAQIRLALLDQTLHAADVLRDPRWCSDGAMHALDARYALVSEPRETRWQGFFGHLVGYGGSYYSYLFDRAIAGKVWDVVFKGGEGAVDRNAGETFHAEVLKWGGARDGWHCVAGVLGEEGELVRRGGEEGMREVGRWGLSAGEEGK